MLAAAIADDAGVQAAIAAASERPSAEAAARAAPRPQKQAASGKRSSPYMAFTRAERFPGPRMSEIGTPGPGDYVV